MGGHLSRKCPATASGEGRCSLPSASFRDVMGIGIAPIPMSRSDRSPVSLIRLLAVSASVFAVVVMYGTYRSYLLLPKIYTATSQIQELSPGPNPSIRSDMEMIRTPEFLLPIINDLGLDKIWAHRVYHTKLDALPPQDSIRYLEDRLRLTSPPGSNVIDIKIASESPKEAADIANAIADRFQVLRWNETGQRMNRARDALSQEMAGQQKVIDEKKAGLEKIRVELSQKGIVISPGVAGLIAADLAARKLDAATGSQQNASALQPLRDLQGQVDQQQSVLDDMNVRLKQVIADGRTEAETLKIISRAYPPESPSLPNHPLDLGMAMVLGFGFGVLVGVLVELAIWLFPSTPARTTGADEPYLKPSEQY